MSKKIKIEQGKIPEELLELEKKRIKKGKEIKLDYQLPLPKKQLGLGAALRGGGRAFNKGGKV